MKKIFTTLFSCLFISLKANALVSIDISAEEFIKIKDDDLVLLDVRTIEEYNNGHIPGAVNLPLDELPDLLAQLPSKNQKIVVYCRTGYRAGKAIKILHKQGYTNLVHLNGDFSEWKKAALPIAHP